jgi:hypothetical protein
VGGLIELEDVDDGLRAPATAAAFAFVIAALLAFGARDFCLDDAWIHLAYAKSLRLGDGLSYNPGDYETGFSSPLWVLLLAVWPLGANPILPVKLLGALLHAGLAWACVRLYVAVSPRKEGWVRAALVGVFTAVAPSTLQASTSGMEATLAALLIVASTSRLLRGGPRGAAVLAAAAVLTRPEALFFLVPLSGGLALTQRRIDVASAGLGAIAGLGVWVAYCLAISGHPFPNTKYVKMPVLGDTSGLGYVVEQVLPYTPWLVGLGGLVLIAIALRDAAETRDDGVLWFAGAWLFAIAAVATSRPLDPSVTFFHARYFTPLEPLPWILVGVGAKRIQARWAALALTPVALVAIVQAADTAKAVREQESSIHLLHSRPAAWIASHLPEDAIVAVEGAGALRWATPRTMTIVDILGLNAGDLAHAPTDEARACALASRRPTHAVLPDPIVPGVRAIFLLEPIADFADAHYALVEQPYEVHQRVYEIRGVATRFEHCWRGDAKGE